MNKEFINSINNIKIAMDVITEELSNITSELSKEEMITSTKAKKESVISRAKAELKNMNLNETYVGSKLLLQLLKDIEDGVICIDGCTYDEICALVDDPVYFKRNITIIRRRARYVMKNNEVFLKHFIELCC